MVSLGPETPTVRVEILDYTFDFWNRRVTVEWKVYGPRPLHTDSVYREEFSLGRLGVDAEDLFPELFNHDSRN